jgi:hypothetical protein
MYADLELPSWRQIEGMLWLLDSTLIINGIKPGLSNFTVYRRYIHVLLYLSLEPI